MSDSQNQIVFLLKPKEAAGFGEVIDFLNATHIRYALTAKPIIYLTFNSFGLLLSLKLLMGKYI